MIQRYLGAAILGGIVTFGLFFMMQALIAIGDNRLVDEKRGKVIDFVRLKKDQNLQTKEKKKPEKEKQEEAPPPPPLTTSKAKPDANATGIASDFNLESIGDGADIAIGHGSVDSDVIPLVRIQATYPERAKERGIEGWVQIEFNVSPRGTVEDPKVISYHPSSIFNNSALRAIKRWKYNPKIVNGKPVPRNGLKVVLDFNFKNS
jgi:protein TonB